MFDRKFLNDHRQLLLDIIFFKNASLSFVEKWFIVNFFRHGEKFLWCSASFSKRQTTSTFKKMVHSNPRRLRFDRSTEDDDDGRQLSNIFDRLSVQQQPQQRQRSSDNRSIYAYNNHVIQTLTEMIEKCSSTFPTSKMLDCYFANVRPVFANQESRIAILAQLNPRTLRDLFYLASVANDRSTIVDIVQSGSMSYTLLKNLI